MATEVASLIFEADTSDLRQAEADLNRVGAAGRKVEQQNKNVAAGAVAANKSFGMMKGGATQLSYQLQDVAVQAQMGTDSFRILAMQGPQIASIFGPGGAIFGAVIALSAALGGALFNSLRNTKEESEDLGEEIDRLAKDFDSLTNAQRNYLALSAAEEIADQKAELQRLQSEANHLNSEMMILGMEGVSTSSERFRDLNAEMVRNASEQDAAKTRIADLTDITKGHIDSLDTEIERLQWKADTIAMNARQIDILRIQTSNMSEEEKAAAIASVMAAHDRIDAYEQEIAAAEDLSKRRGEAARKAAAAEEAAQRQREAAMATAQRQAEAMAAIDDEIGLSDLEKIDQREEEKLERLRAWREQELIDQQLFEEAKTAILAGAEEERADLAKQKEQEVQNMKMAGMDLLLRGQSDTTKAMAKMAMSLADTEQRENAKKIISTSYSAAMKAYEAMAGIPYIGPVLGAIAAAAVIAAGVSFAAQSLSGRALGGQVQAGESYLVGERGPEILTMGSGSGRIIPNEALRVPAPAPGGSGSGGGSANITFQIQANDAAGFAEMLNRNRGQIIGIINEGLNANGREALI